MAKPIVVSIPHQLGAQEARRRIEQGFAGLGQQIPGGLGQLNQSWAGDRMSFSALVAGQTVSGHLDILADAVRMELLLPGWLSLMGEKIRGKLQREGQILLEKK